MSNKKNKPIKARDWNAVSAILRTGGPMKDRRAPRGGTANVSRDLQDEAYQESCDNHEIVLDRAEAENFVEVMRNPPAPNAKLLKLAKEYSRRRALASPRTKD